MRQENFARLPVSGEETIILARHPKKFEEKFKLLIGDPKFQKDVGIVRNKWKVDIDNPGPVESGNDDLRPIYKKYRLSKEWEHILSVYIISNEFEKMFDPHGIQINIDRKNKFAWIKIYPETTLDEVKFAYRRIAKELKRGKMIKTLPAKNANRDTLIYELHLQGKKYKEISQIIDDNYAEKLDQWHLSRIVAKMKKRRESI